MTQYYSGVENLPIAWRVGYCRGIWCNKKEIEELGNRHINDSQNTAVLLQSTTNLMFFSTVHQSIELFHQPTLIHNFLYSLTICLLHYYPRHVWSINMPIFRRKNYTHPASGIFALCKGLQSALNQCTV